MDWTQKILQGDLRSVARLIRDIDDGLPEARAILKELYPHTGKAYVIGITGSPGVGKSTLVDRMIQNLRVRGKTVGVLAVDPTSPFSGGAILGDRIRMQRHSTDEGVFIRSMATRGHFGGLTPSTRGAIAVLDAMGKDYILVETVGVGQDEIEIVRAAHTTLIVLIPGMGDDIQAIKAGILEAGDVFVINKSEREGAHKTRQELQMMIEMDKDRKVKAGWKPTIFMAEAIKNQGIEDLMAGIEDHRSFLLKKDPHLLVEFQYYRARMELFDLVKQDVIAAIMEQLTQSGQWDEFVQDLVQKKTDPYSLSEQIITRYLKDCQIPR
ncbi:MAG: methylmalonyl Co-A mutase-associated GTPase MeaB [Desulfobacca sp.]|nr:methylmalonyl Co-A mutase-associated GTPase MeaB [Desulfobacca sp.]